MISRILAQLVGREEKDSDVAEETDNCANLLEFDDGEWVIIKIHGNQLLLKLTFVSSVTLLLMLIVITSYNA